MNKLTNDERLFNAIKESNSNVKPKDFNFNVIEFCEDKDIEIQFISTENYNELAIELLKDNDTVITFDSNQEEYIKNIADNAEIAEIFIKKVDAGFNQNMWISEAHKNKHYAVLALLLKDKNVLKTLRLDSPELYDIYIRQPKLRAKQKLQSDIDREINKKNVRFYKK